MSEEVRVLMIEDDEIDQMTVRRALKKINENSILDIAVSEAETWELLEKNVYDLILLDYYLPGSDGLSMLKGIKAKGIVTPVILNSSQGDEVVAVDAMKAGAFDYTTKSLLTKDVLAISIRNAKRFAEQERIRQQKDIELIQSRIMLVKAQRMAGLGSWEFFLGEEKLKWSETALELLYHKVHETAPDFKRFGELIGEQQAAELLQLLKGSYQKNVEFNIELEIKKGENVKYFLMKGRRVHDDHSERNPRLQGSIMDISDRILNEKKLRESKEKAEQLARIKQDFLANMSHEIRTPMNAIIGFTNLLMESQLSDDQADYLNAIKQSGQNLLVIINDILDFSKIESGKLDIEKTNFNIKSILNNLEKQYQPLAKQKDLDLFFKFGKRVPKFLKGDPVRLNQVLINLIGNALKFTEEGWIELNVSCEADSNKIRFEVRDTGIGIPEEKVDHIFESFRQASNDTTRKFGGTGLGLSIVKSLVELQGGQIGVESKEGDGAIFWFEIEYEKGVEIAEKAKQVSTQVGLEGLKVLVCEDNSLNQRLVERVMKRRGVELDIAGNGKIGLEMLDKSPYDLVLMDIQMPEMDGLEATRAIRNSGKSYQDIPVIAMTAHAFREEIDRCIEAGMNEHVAKPFDIVDLKSKILDVLSKKGYNFDHSETESPLVEDSEDNSPKKLTPIDQEGRLFDLEYIRDMSDDNDDFIVEMLELYLTETPNTLNAIKDASASNDVETLNHHVHKYRSPTGLLGLHKLNKLAEEIETDLSEGEPISSLLSKIKELNELGEMSLRQITDYLNITPSIEENETTGQLLYDLTYIMELAEDSGEFADEMLELFTVETPEFVSDIQSSLEHGDCDALISLTHKFRSPTSMLGMSQLNQLAEQIEDNLSKEGIGDKVKEDLENLIHLSQQAVVQVKDRMNQP